jgi:hypothetical protein
MASYVIQDPSCVLRVAWLWLLAVHCWLLAAVCCRLSRLSSVVCRAPPRPTATAHGPRPTTAAPPPHTTHSATCHTAHSADDERRTADERRAQQQQLQQQQQQQRSSSSSAGAGAGKRLKLKRERGSGGGERLLEARGAARVVPACPRAGGVRRRRGARARARGVRCTCTAYGEVEAERRTQSTERREERRGDGGTCIVQANI